MLNDENIEIVENVLDFFSYLINNTNIIPGNIDNIIVQYFEEKGEFISIFNEKIISNNFFIRQLFIENLYNFKYQECLDLIENNFNYFINYDPLNIPNIIISIIKLSGEIPWDLINKIIDNKNNIVRWSFFNIIRQYNLDYDKTYKILNNLKDDKMKYISNEADYFINKLKIDENKRDFLDENFENENLDLEIDNKEINYDDMSYSFIKILLKENKNTYDINELNNFVEYYVNNKENLLDQYIKKTAANNQ